MIENYHKFYSQYLKHDFEILVFGESGIPLILFPPEKGRYYDCKDNGLINCVLDLIENKIIKVYCPDTCDAENWFNYDSPPELRVNNYIQFEKAIRKEVIDFAGYETEEQNIILAGCGFGAYHALNLTLKEPNNVKSLISLGGTFDIKPHIFGFYNDNCYFNNPHDYLPGLENENILSSIRDIDFIFGLGEYDSNYSENYKITSLLNDKKINYWLDVKSGMGHDWSAWQKMLGEYSALICSKLERKLLDI